MPTYEYECERCHATYEASRTIAERDDCPDCPRCSRTTTRLIVPSTPPGGKVFTPYSAQSQGVPPHMMRGAKQDNAGNWHRPVYDAAGNVVGSRQVNRPGERLDANGNVQIRSSGERKAYLERHKLVDLRDYGQGGNWVVCREENRRRKAAAERKLAPLIERLKRRRAKGEEAARRSGRKPGGWVKEPTRKQVTP